MEGNRTEFEDKVNVELFKAQQLQHYAQEFESQLDSKLKSLQSELKIMEEKFKEKCSEAVALKAQNISLETSAERIKETLQLQFDELLSDLKNQHSSELLGKDQKLLQLKEQLAAQDRETQLWREKTKKDIELQLFHSFEEREKEFEKRIIEQSNNTFRLQHEKDLRDRIEFENDIRRYYEQQLAHSEETMRSHFNNLLAEHEELSKKQRQELDEDRKKELEVILQSRLRYFLFFIF
jgi:hypothetical protein